MKLNLEGHMKGRNFLFNVPEIGLENFDFLSKTYFVNYLKVGTANVWHRAWYSGDLTKFVSNQTELKAKV